MVLKFRFARVAALASLVLLPALPAAAAQFQLQAGRSFMDSHGTDAVFVESVFDEQPIGDSSFSWSPDLSAGWIDGRNLARYRGAHPGVTDDIWLVAGGARFHVGAPDRWYHALFLSEQGVLHTGHTQALSSVGEFATTLGWQGRRFNVEIRHISNAALHEPNRGETMLLFGIAFGG